MRTIHVFAIALTVFTCVAEPALALDVPVSEAPAAAAPATPDQVLDRVGESARDFAAGRWLLGLGGALWAVFTLLRLPRLGRVLERVPASCRPLVVLASGLTAAAVFAATGHVPPDLLSALGLGGAGLAMGAHDALGPARRRRRGD